MKTFDFGQNWRNFSSRALNSHAVRSARKDFQDLMEDIELPGCWLLDVGYGQGLSILCAAESNANVVGLDINRKNDQPLAEAHKFFPNVDLRKIVIKHGSILSEAVVSDLKTLVPDGFDVVHSWGVLHHTGNMVLALQRCTELLKPGGHFVVSIYNKHWTSSIWRLIKIVYCCSPVIIQKGLVYLLAPVIWVAKLLVTWENPNMKERGMDFMTDVVDWIGGYPYEYSSIEEFCILCQQKNLSCVRVHPAKIPTGCNEFVFRKPLN